MTLKAYAIFKEKLTGGLTCDVRMLVNFHASSRKSENVHFDRFVFSKAYKVQIKKYRGAIMSHDTEE